MLTNHRNLNCLLCDDSVTHTFAPPTKLYSTMPMNTYTLNGTEKWEHMIEHTTDCVQQIFISFIITIKLQHCHCQCVSIKRQKQKNVEVNKGNKATVTFEMNLTSVDTIQIQYLTMYL